MFAVMDTEEATANVSTLELISSRRLLGQSL